MAKKIIYAFGNGSAEGNGKMKELLGGKGAGLAEMSNLGVPVPPGFTITTEACTAFYAGGRKWPKGLDVEVKKYLKRLEKSMGRVLGDPKKPLLVSVRSGARASMPGMMDTILNLGLNDASVEGLGRESDNERFAWDSYRRFIQMYSDVVLDVSKEKFEHELTRAKESEGVKYDAELSAAALRQLVTTYKKLVKKEAGVDFPQDPWKQLEGAIGAVFLSWNNQRAIDYRRIYKIPGEWGTAVNVQSMVFGNMGNDSGTGVAFTRDPSNGENRFYGEYLLNAQGEDVVAGIRTPHPINRTGKDKDTKLSTLEEEMPEVYEQLCDIRKRLEKHYRDMLDVEFTIQQGTLYMLQSRVGKRTGAASVRIAVEMAESGLIDKKTAVMRVSPDQLDQLLHPTLDPSAKLDILAKGLPASPGAVSGRVVFSADDAVAWVKKGEAVMLTRLETSPEDIHGMEVAKGILTARGGMTSHAAVVARGMGKPCVAGCGDIHVDYDKQQFTAAGRVVKEGDWITIDGVSGRVVAGRAPTVSPKMDRYFAELMQWADTFRKLKVRTNADTPPDAVRARGFGAEGIGLCRTEHMFFGEKRLPVVREMILNMNDQHVRQSSADKLMPMQKDDFLGIFKAMEGLPVTIRLLDPPLHEFLPNLTELTVEIEELRKNGKDAKKLSAAEALLARVQSLHELNPMLGHRGCRLGITFPELYDMPVRAIMEAACELTKKGVKVLPEIMIPLVGTPEELAMTRQMAVKVADEVQARLKVKVPHLIGTMIEVPRAAVCADEIAKEAEFFSFGTNDLTQMTFGYSRDDAFKFLPKYVEVGILKIDPFISIDQKGVGVLMEMAVQKGRSVRKKLKCGICGEHGGEAASVMFCHRLGLDYVSCSPFRVPLARLAAAHAAIEEAAAKRGKGAIKGRASDQN
ncbi:MAG: pyruvate, phosphate dikinase [Candidatus Wallbacteria bacterium]|nr:pyruvate, phosphate dikinase [Candidatus Wallbacteria bacterium]